MSTTMRLYPYQEMAITAAEDARQRGQARALWVMPTGTGKTVTFGELVRRRDVPTLILAHREELLTQARDKLAALGIALPSMGIVGAGFNEMGRQITIGSVQSLSRAKRLEWLARTGIELVVVDECHHRTAATYRRVLDALAGVFELGVTATPDRADGGDLSEVYGPAVFTLKLPEMIRDGYLCDLRGIQVKTGTTLDGVRTRAGDFAADELQAVINRADRNQVIVDAWQRHAADRLTLAFTAGVQHAYDLAEVYRDAGVNAAALDGTTDRDDRRHLLRDYAAGVVRVITNCQVLTEGFDAPETSCIVLAKPTQSRPLYVQMVGRGTRTAPGKVDCLVLDVADLATRHSLTVQNLPQLVGRAGYDAAPKPRAVKDDGESEDDSDAGFSLRAALDAPVIDKSVKLLGEAFAWQSRGDGSYTLALPGATLWLVLHETGYVAGIVFSDGHRQQLTREPMPLDWAMTVAEQTASKIRDGRTHLVDNRAPWRANPASDAQLWKLRKLGIRAPRGCTKGEACELIDAAMAKRAS